MKPVDLKQTLRCAIYTRVSTEHGLEQEFNSLDNQREASEAYVKSQSHEGWKLIRDRYDDGGYSGGSMERPALQVLLDDVRARRVDVIVVYKVDRLTRSLADFAKLVELFDAHGVSFVSVTQSFNTTTSMGRLTLNVLLSFAQFEREVTGERIRDKIAASKKRGIWMGGVVPLGYRVQDRALHIVEEPAAIVRDLFRRYLDVGTVVGLQAILEALYAVSRALGVTISWFFDADDAPEEERDLVVRRARRRRLDYSAGVVDELLSPNLTGALELLSCRFPPGASSGDEPYTHSGEEAGVVIRGRLELCVGERTVTLEAGDSFGFQSALPHRYRNPGPDEAEVIWAITPPSY
jgi:DNA invertase Pin-like site-specific DNA recombinase